MKGLPDVVHIGALTYEIVEEPRLKEEGDFARIRLTEAVIEVATPMHADVARVHILHEVIHAMLMAAGIVPPHDEQYIGALANGFISLVRDNPELLK